MSEAHYRQAQNVLNGVIANLYTRAQQMSRGGVVSPIGVIAPSGGDGIVIIDDPEYVDIIASAPDLFRKNYSYVSQLGASRFNTNGNEWHVRRNITQPYYINAARPGRELNIRATYQRIIAEIDPTDPRQPERAFFEASLTVFHDALECDSFDLDQVLELFNRLRDSLRILQLLSWMPAQPGAIVEAAKAASQSLLKDLTVYLESDPSLTSLMQRFVSSSEKLPGFSPVEEFLMNLFAGVETSVSTLLWAVDQLAVNPQVQDHLYEEVSTGKDIFPYLDCYWHETMRRFPPIPFVVRQVAESTELGGVRLQPRQFIIISIIGVHHNPQYWHNPQIFDATRNEFLNNNYDKRAFIPFFVGPRMCGGAKLGRLEIREGLKALLQNFSVEHMASLPGFDYALAMRPTRHTPVKLIPRHS